MDQMTYRESRFRSKTTETEVFRISAVPPKPNGHTVLAFHGLGDHSMCHQLAFEMFGALGYRVEAFDWPGNGQSEGRRGDIPGVEAAIEAAWEVVEMLDEKPTGLYAHSTGGFIGLPFLSKHAQSMPLEWAWLSSPLLRPTHKQSRFKMWMAAFMADNFPTLTIPTGVRPSQCIHINDFDLVKIKDKFDNCHSRVSARFARDLMLWEKQIATAASQLQEPLRLLITQGKDDEICPAEFTQTIFDTIQIESKSLVLLHNIRHEPLREPNNNEFLTEVKQWLNENTQI